MRSPAPATVAEKGFARNFTKIEHFNALNFNLNLISSTDLEKAPRLIKHLDESN